MHLKILAFNFYLDFLPLQYPPYILNVAFVCVNCILSGKEKNNLTFSYICVRNRVGFSIESLLNFKSMAQCLACIQN